MEASVLVLSINLKDKLQNKNYNIDGVVYSVCDVVFSVSDLVDSILLKQPNVIIVDEAMFNDFTLVAFIKMLRKIINVPIVVIGTNASIACSGCYFVDLNFLLIGLTRVFRKINNALGNNGLLDYGGKQSIYNKLEKYKFSSSLLGYNYLVDAIEECLNKNCHVKNIENEVYGKIAEKYNVSLDSVERNIRNAIKNAKDECHILMADELFNNCYDLKYGGNKRFILNVANQIKNNDI